jgi:hypothetical protein
MGKGFNSPLLPTLAGLAFCCIGVTACGADVAGSTYSGNGGVVRVEFKSGGKAYVSTGPVTTTCSYTEGGGKVTLICEGDKTVFTVDGNDALNGPEGGFLGRLTKQK